MKKGTIIVAALLAGVVACENSRPPTAPVIAPTADRAGSGEKVCPTRADFIVSTEAQLASAVAGARPGQVIGVKGVIVVNADINITTAGVTLTCATLGSGLVAAPTVVNLIAVDARNVVVDRLVLDGSQAQQPYIAQNDGVSVFAQDIRFTNNTVTCSPDNSCAIVLGGTGAVIADNHFEAPASFDGVHVEAGGDNDIISMDGARVERNTIIATAPSTGLFQGAIRVFQGNNLVIADNTILGPWRNGLSPARMNNSRVEGNRVDGAVRYGIILSEVRGTLGAAGDHGNLFRNNRVTNTGLGGIFAQYACGNRFVDNDLRNLLGNIGITFSITTGANTVMTDDVRQFLIVDNGAYDCNGDGVNDPNIIKDDDGVKIPSAP